MDTNAQSLWNQFTTTQKAAVADAAFNVLEYGNADRWEGTPGPAWTPELMARLADCFGIVFTTISDETGCTDTLPHAAHNGCPGRDTDLI
ncbi:hypothetical protein [Dactylosporangium sp. CS-033363]|uniref:hypothetical protein n=1 Tax=Dactylosporangium sp. CS-033363 TaxID=3239935 RepID=UPI003D8B7CEC